MPQSLLRFPSLVALLLAASCFAGTSLAGQSAHSSGDAESTVVLADHHRQWASQENDLGPLAPNVSLDSLTMVLSRTPQQEQVFRQFLADQQNPASPRYHQWLTPDQIGARFGLSNFDLAAVLDWLQSQGLRITWVAPSRTFIGFAGTSANLGRAFHTELHTYRVNGVERTSVSSDPLLPASFAPHIKAIRGLFSLEERPLHHAMTARSDFPELSTSTGTHYLAPQDFATIYDLPSGATGAGQTIGIVGRSRTDFADFEQFRQKTGTTFANPIEVVPTALGGVDPGPALTAPPSSGNTEDQLEATLDVTRAGSIAKGAQVLLVVATSGSGGIGVDTQYLVQTTPVPAQVINISFGACESSAGSANVDYWDNLFQQASAEGISVFVASGDSGAAGCDAYFSTPPAGPAAISPNYICSSSYATCVGGTEFNDTGNLSQYWSSSNSAYLGTALGYIPEGSWNEPLYNSKSEAAASGGGVSAYIATPAWQTGTGVPSKRAGRYTPDIAFSSSGHDGYFACFAAGSGSCVTTNGSFFFEYFFGTSAAAPDMAGITALLDEKLGAPQGNLAPSLYELATSSPTVFHDVTVASSGVVSCSINTPSMCNNSIPGPSGLTGGEAGYLLNAGYDEVTGLGSLDVSDFLHSFSASVKTVPTVSVSASASSITTVQSITVAVSVTSMTAGAPAPSGTVTLTSGTYSSAATALSSGNATINLPAGSLAVGSDTVTATYSGDSLYNTATGRVALTVTAPFNLSGTAVTVAAGATTGNASTITVAPTGGFTGTVALTATLTASPANALHPPTFSFSSTGSVNITGANSGTATLTITTTPSGGCTQAVQATRPFPWYSTGGAALAGVLFLLIPPARRWRKLVAFLILLGGLSGGLLACGGSHGTSNCGAIIPGTTSGQYTITIAGTSGTTTQTGTVVLTVQ